METRKQAIDTSEHTRTILGVEGRAFARHVWPNDPKVPARATDADLSQEPEALKAALLARLPQLLVDFRAAMDACGFAWEAPQS